MCEEHSRFSGQQLARKNAGIQRRRMDIRLIEQVLSKTQNSPLREIIPSTMGEPLLYQNFDQIIGFCKLYNLKLNLTTNGSFPGIGVHSWAKKIVPVASDVKVSWNGAKKETQEMIMIGSNWEKGIKNIKTLIMIRDEYAKKYHHRCQITLQITFMEHNINEIIDIIKLAASLGVDRVKGHHLWVHFEETASLDMRRNQASKKIWNETVRQAMITQDRYRLENRKKIILDNFHYLPEDNMLETKKLSVNEDWECPFLGQEAWVSAAGKFSPCCAPDQERTLLGNFGNLYHTSLLDIWNSSTYQDLVLNYKKFSVCQKCTMRRPKRNGNG